MTDFGIFGGFCTRLWTDPGEIWRATVDPRCTLSRQISSHLVHCVALWTRKCSNFATFSTSVILRWLRPAL